MEVAVQVQALVHDGKLKWRAKHRCWPRERYRGIRRPAQGAEILHATGEVYLKVSP